VWAGDLTPDDSQVTGLGVLATSNGSLADIDLFQFIF